MLFRGVCTACWSADIPGFSRQSADDVWRMYHKDEETTRECPRGKFVCTCPHWFEHLVAAGMEKRDGND